MADESGDVSISSSQEITGSRKYFLMKFWGRSGGNAEMGEYEAMPENKKTDNREAVGLPMVNAWYFEN